ncbi:RadC family protein [Fusibacter tunisiensis]|uniref:DNA repair protein RadC n=1 Tax=Fusibacter tunisiensis TaxID=1008308 RepID=A0ABS2MN62_9FIRM|nr:DNA repair protein RadC [Fusibacter tunisiensis]MBM7560762.1 DNA repair protein RadC [Fusibacter tunisiensis]
MIKGIPQSEQPREKMISLGVETLSNSELLAILIRTGTKHKTAVQLAQELVNSCSGDFSEFANITLEELSGFTGIGPSKACQILAAVEVGKRVKMSGIVRRTKVSSPADIYQYFSAQLSDLKVEKFIIVLLNTKNEIINWEMVSMGSLNASIVHPREVYNRAVKRSAASILVLHNHPSGHVKPSAEDINITRRLKESGTLLGIPLIDHLIIGKDSYFSFKEENLL